MKKLILIGIIVLTVIIGVVVLSLRTQTPQSTIPKSVQSQLPLDTLTYRIEIHEKALRITLYPKPLKAEEEELVSIETRYQMSENEALSALYSLGLKNFTDIQFEWVRE